MPACRGTEEGDRAPRAIVVGCDASSEAAAAVRHAASVASATGARLTLLHVAVAPPWVSLGTYVSPVLDDLEADGAELVRRLVAELPAGIGVDWRVLREDDPLTGRRRAICRGLRAALGGADQLVVGTGPRPGRIARALLRRCPGQVHVVASPVAPEPPLAAPRTASVLGAPRTAATVTAMAAAATIDSRARPG